MGRHERPIVEYWKILSELAHGGHLNYVFVEQVEVAARKIRKISITTMVLLPSSPRPISFWRSSHSSSVAAAMHA